MRLTPSHEDTTMKTMTTTTTSHLATPAPVPSTGSGNRTIRVVPRRRHLRALACALALLPVAPALVGAQQIERIDERQALNPGASVTVETLHHRIEVERWDRTEIHITGDYDAGYERATAMGDASNFRFRITVVRDFRGEWNTGTREPLRVRVPRDVHLHLKTISGSVVVPGGTGEVEVETVNGSVELSGTAVRSRLSSVSGSIQVRGTADDIRVQNVSGSIVLEGDYPRFEARSVSGGLRVESRTPVSHGVLNSVSGRVRFQAPLARDAELSAESHSGAVELHLSGPLHARFRLNTFSGSIQAELPNRSQEERERSRFTPNERLTFVVGDGTGRVSASSFSGNLMVRPGG
jgi:hypothetical protein